MTYILLFLGAVIFDVKKKSRETDNEEAYCNGFFPYPFLIGSLGGVISKMGGPTFFQ